MKYIIDLEKIEGAELYKVKGCNTLIFDKNSIENILTPYNEETKQDEIFLLSAEGYEKYKDRIPHINILWCLRSPGRNDNYILYVNSTGMIDYYGYNVNIDNYAIRPALRYSNLKSKIIESKVKDAFIFNETRWIIIDKEKEIAIAELPIAFRRFDEKSNNYETSEIRKWLLDWVDEKSEIRKYLLDWAENNKKLFKKHIV